MNRRDAEVQWGKLWVEHFTAWPFVNDISQKTQIAQVLGELLMAINSDKGMTNKSLMACMLLQSQRAVYDVAH